MSVKIRLTRTGRKKKASYRIVAIDSRKARDAKCLDTLGIFHPLASGKDATFTCEAEKIAGYLKDGAQPSHCVQRLLKNNTIISNALKKDDQPKTDKKKKKGRRKKCNPIAQKVRIEKKAEAVKKPTSADSAEKIEKTDESVVTEKVTEHAAENEQV